MYKILIVEDDETIRNGIKTLLELQDIIYICRRCS